MRTRSVAGALLAVALVQNGSLRTARAAAGTEPPAGTTAPDTLAIARLSVADAMAAATRGEILLVDVRPSGQRALGHIRGDVYIPGEQLPARQAELPKDRRLVFYCSCHAEESALDAARTLLAAGHSQVGVLVGGYDAWRVANGPTQVDARWEDIFRVSEPPAGWGKTPVDTARCRYTRDTSVAAQGKASGKMVFRPASGTRGFAGYSQKLDAAALRERQVTLSAMVRTENVERGAYLWIGAEDAQGRVSVLVNPRANLITGTQDWRRHEVSCTVPPAAVRVLIGVTLTATGDLWLDDVRLAAPEAPGLPLLQPPIVNPSFEE